jgi:hypothetical protein
VRETQESIAWAQNEPVLAEEAGRAFEQGGTTAVFRWLLENMDKYNPWAYSHPAYRSMIYSRLGETDRSIDELQKAVDARSASAFDCIRDPTNPHRDDPRFKKIVEEVGLAP